MSSDSGSSLSTGEDQLAIDQRYQVLQADHEGTQKRTFCNWINSKLSKHPQSSVVKDLFVDLEDGHLLLDLLEVLSGENLPREKGKNIFQARSNIESALNFLGKRSIKLINIHVEDIISGKPSIVLGLIWQIILHFHIEGLASILESTDDQQPVTCETKNGVSPTASPSPKRSAKSKWKTSAKKALLQWAQERCAQSGSIDIKDFKSSWKNGMAFLTIIQSLRPDLINMDKLQGKSNEEKLQEAFRIAENELQIPKLIEPEDLTVSDPDEKSIMTYVAQFLQYSKNMEEPAKDMSARVNKAMEWLKQQENTLKKLFSEMKNETYTKKYQEILLFMRKFNEQKRIFMSGLAVESLQDEEQLLIKQSLENITLQIAEWKKELDRSLPPPLDSIETWLTEVENLMSQALPESGSHYNTMSLLQALSDAYKTLMIDAKNHMEGLRMFKNVDDAGVVIVPTDKTEEMIARLEKILAANFSVLVDYRCAGYYVLALLEEGRPKLKSWKVKQKSQESVKALLTDYKDFVEGKQFMALLDTAFQKFTELHSQLLTTDDYSGDPEIAKQYEAIELKYKTFVSSAHDAESTLEQVQSSWNHFENNISLITAWLDEQQRIAPSNVPMEILSKWKSVHKSLNRDGNFLIERTYEKTASKISQRLKSLNSRWTRYVKQYKEQKAVGNGSPIEEELGVDFTEGASKTESDISAHSLSLYIQSLQRNGEDAKAIEMYSEILSHLEAAEKVIEAADSWSGKAELLLSDLDQKENTQKPLSVDIQDLYDNGISCQEQLEKTEVNLQALTHLLYSHEDLQRFNLDRWRHHIVSTRERVQDLVSRVSLVLHPPEQSLSEEDIKRNFESSKSNLETYITKALSLLGQKITPEEFISQYETSLSKFGSQDLEHFLKATDHMKNISQSTKEKSLVEDVSADVRNRWKNIHDELETYVSELKMHIGKKKFDKLICKLDKQILKEKNNTGVDTEELLREHEVVFSDHGCLGELNHCLQTMQSLDDRLRSHAAPTTFTTLITECTKKKEELNKKAADIHLTLQSILEKKKIGKRIDTSVKKKVKPNLNKTNGTQEVCEMDDVLKATNMAEDNEPTSSSLEMVLQRYDNEKSHLESIMQSAREKLVAESPKEVQDVKDLQCKLHELQILLEEANRSWMEFEATSQKVEVLLQGTEKKKVSEIRYGLQYSLSIVSEEIKSRIQALSITINVLLPIEEEVSLLCESSGQTPVHGVEKFTISNIGSICQDLQDVQSTVKDQIQQCHNLESTTEVVDPTSPVDIQAVQSIVHQYKIQLETTHEIMEERQVLVKELEEFLLSLATTKKAIQDEAAVYGNDRRTLLHKKKNLEKLQQKVYKLRQDAEKLDKRLEPAEIFLEDPLHGEPTSCQKMLDGFFEKIEIVEQSILLELQNLESRPASELQPLNGTVNDSLQPEMERFTVSKLHTVLQEMKNIQDTFDIEIQNLDNLDTSSTEPVSTYKTELQATNEEVKERETTLKSLGVFLATLKATKMSIEAGFPVPGMDRTTLQEKQLNLESLEKDIYLLGQEAEKLDDCMQDTGILLEDPENGGETSCKKMISGFFEKLESAQQAIQRELQNLQEPETFDHLSKQMKNFCKNMEDIQDQIDKVGLQDPTIHAVQQRIKALIILEKRLETFQQEKNFISDTFQEFLQTSQRKDLPGYEECEELWEDTKQHLVHSKEQCEVIIELLRKFQHYRTTLTSLIQKAEATISHQSSYIGKDNLHKMMMKVQELKQEIENHSENVDEISSICKKLQFHISKIKRFEDAPFQVEANTLIDKWLDICEKLDGYNENIKSAVCLWNKVLQLSQEMEPWIEEKLRFLESANFTSDDVQLLRTELQNQDKVLEEISRKSSDIEKLLQSDELPFELQVVKTSLVNKISVISTILSRKTENEDMSSLAAASDSPDGGSVAKELPQITGKELPVHAEPEAQTKVENFGMEVEPEAALKDRQQSPTTTLVVEPNRAGIQEDSQEAPQGEEKCEALRLRLTELQKKRQKLSPDLQPRLQDNVKQLASFRELLQESQDMMGVLEASMSMELSPTLSPSLGLHSHWLEIKLELETFIMELQDTMQILERHLEGHRQYESLSTALNNKMTSFYEELLNFSRSSRENAPCDLKRQKLQELHDQYEGLQGDLAQVSQLAENVKKTSSSKGVKWIEEAIDMHHSKMRGFFERIDHLKQVIEQPPTIIEKRKGKKTKKGSKKKLETQRSIEEASLQTTMKAEEDSLVMATVSSLMQPTDETTVQPVVDISVQETAEPLVQHTADVVLQSAGESSVQPVLKANGPSTVGSPEKLHPESSVQTRVEVLVDSTVKTLMQTTKKSAVDQSLELELSMQRMVKPSVQSKEEQSMGTKMEQSTQPTVKSSVQATVDLPLQPTVEPTVQHIVELPVQPTVEPTVQATIEPSTLPTVEPTVQPTEEILVPPTLEPSMQPTVVQTVQTTIQASIQSTVEPSVHPTVDLSVKPTELSVQPKVEPLVQRTVESSTQPKVQPTVQLIVELPVEPTVKTTVQPTEEIWVQPTVEPIVHPTVEPKVQPTVEISMQSVVVPSLQPTVEPLVQPTVESSTQPTVQPTMQPVVELPVEPTVKTTVQPTEEILVQPTVEPIVHPTVEPIVHPTVEPIVQPTVEPTVQPIVEPIVQPTVEISMQSTVVPSVQPIVDLSVQPKVELPVQPTVKPSEPAVHPIKELSAQPVHPPNGDLLQSVLEPSMQTTAESVVEASEQFVVVSPLHIELDPSLQPEFLIKKQSSVEIHSTVKPTETTFVKHTESSTQSEEDNVVQDTEQLSSVLSTAELLLQSGESSAQTSLKTLKPPVEELEDAATHVVKDSVQFAIDSVHDSSVQPALEAVGPSTVETHHKPLQPAEEPKDQSALRSIDTVNPKEQKSSKGRKKKKKIHTSTAGKPSVETQEVKEPITSMQKRDMKSAESVDGESIHKKHYVNVKDSSEEAAEAKALEEAEAKRQAETLINDLTVSDNDSFHGSGLITTEEERLRGTETLQDDGEKLVISNEAQDIEWIRNQQTSDWDVPAPQLGSVQTESETISKELHPCVAAYQQEAVEVCSQISQILGGKLLQEECLERLAGLFKLGYVKEDIKMQSEKSPQESNIENLKKNIAKFSKEPVNLDLIELDQEIGDIEELCNNTRKLQDSRIQLNDEETLPSDHKDPLEKLIALKTEKQKLRQEFMNFQNTLSAARLSYQMLTKEKENLKMSVTESHQSHLDKLGHVLDKLAKEKETLNVLKSQQSNIRDCRILCKDKDDIDVDIRQLEAFWEQIDLSLQRERDRLMKEAEELKFLEQKVNHLQSIIQVQQDLLDQPTPSPEDMVKASLLLSADVESIKHLFSLLRSACDLQIKRSCENSECKSLECSLDNVQCSLENLEERVKDQQLTRCQTPDAMLDQYPFLKHLYDLHIWVKKLQNIITFDQTIALLPRDVEKQMATSKNVHKEILDRKSTVSSVIEESKLISQGIDPAVFRDICSFFQQLQELYQEQIIQSVDRLQRLESGLEKRRALFSEIEKLKELLHCLEKEATPVKRGIFTAAELCEQLNCLKAKTTELEEIEGLVLTLLRNSQSYHRELKISEQLYLNDILRSLKSKARRIRRLEEKKLLHTEKLLRICNEFQERTTSLSRELSSLQPIEPEMHDEAEKQDGDGFEKKFEVSQNAISSSQVHLSEILRYKDLFEDSGLYWDGLTVDNLQNKSLSFPMHGSGHFGHYEPVKERYQELLEEAKMMCFSVQRDALAVGSHFDVIEAQVLCKKIKKISILATEALNLLHEKHDSQDALHDGEPMIRALAENMDRLHQSLSQVITAFHTKEKSNHYQLEQTLCNFRKIHQDLPQPCVVNLDSVAIQDQLLRLEAYGEICKSELKTARALSSQASTDEILGQLNEIKDVGKQVENTIAQHDDTIKKTFHVLQELQQTIAKLAELFRQHEEKLQKNPVDFYYEEDPVNLLNSQQEEISIAIAKTHDIIGQLKCNCSLHDQEQLDDLVNQITIKNMLLTEIFQRKQSVLSSYHEKRLLFKSNKQKICKDLEEIEAIIRDSFCQKPTSYKAALAQWEKSKNMVTKVNSCEEELLQLKQSARELSAVSGDDVSLCDKEVAALWDRWRYLLGVCRDWELYCDELKQEWKLISELLEREVILLDICQEEVPDKPEMKQKTVQLLNSVAEISCFEENMKMQRLQLSLLMCRLQNILGKPEVNMETETATVIKEIGSMEDKCEVLLQKSQKNKQKIQKEIEDREALKGEFSAVKQSLQQVPSKLETLEPADPETTRVSLQEIQSVIESQKEAAKLIMEKVSARYAEHVPAELQSQAEECQVYLQEMEEKVKNEALQSSPENIMNRKVNEIKSGLQSIEVHLTEKSQNILQAKELQKKLWDEVDTWLSKLHALEAEVQEMAEEDPSQAQEWMDKLTEPFSHYQQVTHLVERRTTNLNKAASKLEEYEDTLKSIQTWIQNTDNLLNEEMKDCSAKVLNKHVVALEIALDDSEQKQHLLDSIHSELSDLALIFETETIVERSADVRNKVLALRQRIMKVLPKIQLIAHEVLDIEDEVKKMERTVNKIKTILTSNDIDDMTPKDHHMHGQVMLENISHIRKTIAEIEVYRPSLPLSECGVKSLCVFRRMVVVLKEAEMLEKVIMEQNQLLEPIISEISELEKEHEKAQQVSREDSSDVKERAEVMKKHMERLNQKKEVILLAQRNSLNEHLERLKLEPHDQDLESMLSPITEGMNIIQMEVQRRDSYFLPSLAEETEDSTLMQEAADDSTGVNVVETEDEQDVTRVPLFSQEQLGHAGQTLADVQPEMILSDCQGKVTEVELWLRKVNLSPEESKQDPDMLQSVEEQLAECQKTLQETEKKINLLLENSDYRQQGNGTVLEEAETLSLKLKALKKSLENVQEVLQVKSASEQIHNGVKEEKLLHSPSRTANSAEKTQVFNTEMSTKKHLTELTVLNEESYLPSHPRSPVGDGPSSPTKPRSKTPLSVIEDITWSKWLYLQKELSYRIKATSSRHTNEPDTAKEVKIRLISRIPAGTVKSPLVEDAKHFLTRLKGLNEEASSPLTQESARNLHGALFVWMCSVSQWLQNIEEMLDLEILTREEAAAELTLYEKLMEDFHALSEEMANKTSVLLSPITHEGAQTNILFQCYNDLRDWLIQIHSTVKTRYKRMQGELEKHNNYQNDIRHLYDVLVKKKSNLIQRLNTSGVCEVDTLIEEAAVYEKELMSYESQVSSLNERGEKLSIPICSNQDVHKLEDVLDDTWHILRSNQDKCSSAAINKSQVDALLCGLSGLLCLGKEKIENSKEYLSRSKESLNSHIENHRKFFSHLESQVLLLQALTSRKSSPDVDKQRIEPVTQEAETMIQHSDDHCINMMVIMKNWTDFDSKYDYLSKKYEALEAMIPTSSLVEESVERVIERLKQFQKIQKHIDENESRLSQIMVVGKKLQSTVACSELDGQMKKLEQQWSQLTKKVNHEQHRLESLISHLASYNKDSSELSTWLESARQRLSSSRIQSLDASQKLNTIKNNLNTFFEFTNDVDQKSSLKTSVVNAGNQLLRLKESDTSALKLSLTKFEEGWTDLIGSLPATQEKLQQQLVEKLPSLEAIQELMDWMKEDTEIGELQSIQHMPTTAADIRCLLQRYKGLRREMSHKQFIVDYVNQSLLQLSVGDVEIKRYERTELAELLGTLNLQWNQMLGNINAKIQHLEQALESISDQECRSQTLSNWFDAQQQRLKKLHRPSSITAAESVLAECMVLEEQLKAKSTGIEELEANRVAIGGESGSSEGVLTTEALFQKKDQVAKQVAELKTSTLSVLEHWKDYNDNYGQVQKMTVKLQYVLDQSTTPSPSMNSLNQRLNRLQAIQEEMEQHEEKWSRLRVSLSGLKPLCSQSAMDILKKECREIRDRWTLAGAELSEQLRSAKSLLQEWKDYTGSCLELTPHIEQVEEKCEQLLCAKLSEDRASDTLEQRIQDLKALEQNVQALRAHNLQVSELSDKVLRQNPAATDVIQSERQNTSHRIALLERRVSSKAAELKFIQNEVESFRSDLDKLQSRIKSSADVVSHVYHTEQEKEERSEVIKKHLLELSELTSDVERLHEDMFTLPLDDHTQMSLQNLNRMWAKTIATALEDCRQHRMIELEKNTFIQNYETWILCLEKMEDNLTEGIAGTFEALRKQQEIYERLQAEITINEHILPSFVTKALSVLELEDEQNRNELILKLTSLKEKWQSVIRLVQQKKKEISGLLKQWWHFRVSKQSLEQHLHDIQEAVSSVHRQKYHSLTNTEKLMYDFKDKERQLKRLQPSYYTTLSNCKDILSVAEPESKEVLQRDLNQLQDLWQNTTQQLQAILTQFAGIAQKRHSFDRKIENKRKTLYDLKARVDEPLPTLHEELQIAKGPLKELEEALDEWGDSLKDLDDMKSELSQYIIAEDGIVLNNQVEALHRQWEELCLRVSMRKQEIEDRLNAWNIFNEKNKELCDWLTQMESKVLQTGDVNIEEMIEKLQKDCMEEINLFSENKLHLKQIGDQLIHASNQARSKDIENKLNNVNDRWKHLFDVIGSRVKKLKETLVNIQHLYKNMSNLRTWLARIESELSKPVIYSICDDQEINKKLEEQRDLQKDIEVHSPGVASVLNICERLLHDTDACANETECDSIQQTTRSLDKRWRNICSMSMERRMRIEETCRLWQKFLEDYSRFDEWLKEAEAMAASPDSSDVLYTKAKEEQKKFEAFQRQIHERLTHLELINKQYRRLARENRTDAASRLKQMVHEGNQRWDQLQKRVTSILRRLKHFTSQREDFEGTRDSILVWLTEMDLQLTNVEHFSESDIEEKMQQLIGFKQEITLNTNKIDQLIVFGEQLIQKSEAMDAVVIEDELEEIHRYCQEVFGRVYRFHERLTSRNSNLEEERETSENDTDGEDSREIQNSSWHSTIPEVETSHQSLCHLMPPTLPHERSGRETPVSVDSIPLEWDPTVDVGGSSMNENEDEGAYYNPLSGKSDLETPSWHSPDKHVTAVKMEFKEDKKGLVTATPGSSTLLDLSASLQETISSAPVESESRPLNSLSEQVEDKGLQGMTSPETHTGVIERWEIIHARTLSNELSKKQTFQRWKHLIADLDDITLWLDRMEVELEQAKKLKPSSTLQELEQKVNMLKDIVKGFDDYKARIISANLNSKEFQPEEDEAEYRDMQSKLHMVNVRWERACCERDSWRESLQSDLLQCEEFQERSDQLLLWLTEAEERRLKHRVIDISADRHVLLESQKNLMQLKEELLQRQTEANTLQDLCSTLLSSSSGTGYIEAEERMHVIGTRMRQLFVDISQDLSAIQKALDASAADEVDSLITTTAHKQTEVGTASKPSTRIRKSQDNVQEAPKKRSFFYRVLRAAFPLQLLLLLLLFFACMIPVSEDDFSCAQANNFARSFYPMLRYTNGPPPT
ncbi:nesprin-2 isoform 2-T2 [Leptodactylus fuscus]|uniref:nesprin-2 isoform X2 n=1 Tax=Leptodactylus fuscus TaxID=238119 RepID=UPI003F4ED1F8